MNELILVVDDDEKVTQIIRAYLEKEGYSVQVATDGESALEKISSHKPSMIILDRMLPKLSGDLLCTKLRQQGDIPILILSALVSEEDRIFGLQIGADDYLTKPFSPRELVTRVMALLRRTKKSPPESWLTFNHHRLQINTLKYEVLLDGVPISLTPTEFQLLLILATHPGQVFRRDQLLDQLQGYSFEGYERTIDVHIKNLRHKIETDPSKPVYIKTVFGIGYKFDPQKDPT